MVNSNNHTLARRNPYTHQASHLRRRWCPTTGLLPNTLECPLTRRHLCLRLSHRLFHKLCPRPYPRLWRRHHHHHHHHSNSSSNNSSRVTVPRIPSVARTPVLCQASHSQRGLSKDIARTYIPLGLALYPRRGSLMLTGSSRHTSTRATLRVSTPSPAAITGKRSTRKRSRSFRATDSPCSRRRHRMCLVPMEDQAPGMVARSSTRHTSATPGTSSHCPNQGLAPLPPGHMV
jgi:hypothetical protein